MNVLELLDIASQILGALEEDGALDMEQAPLLDELLEEAPEKIEALAYVAGRLRKEQELLEEEYRRIRDRRDSIQLQQARVKEWAKELMVQLRALGELEDDRRLRTIKMTVWLQKTMKVVGPDDIAMWPARWIRETVSREPDRKRARQDLEDGAESQLVKLVETESVRWR